MNLIYKTKDGLKNTNVSNDDVIISTETNMNQIVVTVKALTDITLVESNLSFDSKFNSKDSLFFNGYQSWTDSFEHSIKDKEKNIYKYKIKKIGIKKFSLDKYGDSTFYKYSSKKKHGYDLFYSKGEHEMFIFSLNYKNAYLIIESFKKKLNLKSDLRDKKLNKDDSFEIFNFKKYDSYNEGLEDFDKSFKTNKEKIFGYTSWYNYYQNINENIILRDLDGLDQRFNLFQIDDGYETFVGDWLNIDKKKFPNGLKPIIDKIHSKGLKAGIWLAPFVAEEKSELFTKHKDMFKKDSKGEFVKCGCNWSGFYALDLEQEKVRDYIKESLTYYKNLGFDFFKLDFLYATSIVTYDGLTRAEAAYKYYSFIREILCDKLVLGCGANLFSSYQNFDYLRVGPDVSLKFDDVFFMRFMHRERNSTKHTIQNTIYRSIFDNKLFLNDSDVFLLRDDNIELTKEQKYALLEINSLFSSVLMTSDNIGNYDLEKKVLLDHALNLFNNALDIQFKKNKNKIIISYKLDGNQFVKVYDTNRGKIYAR